MEQAAQLHHFRGNNAVGTVPAEKLVGVPRRSKAAFVIKGRLLGELLSGPEFVPPLFPDLDNIAGKFSYKIEEDERKQFETEKYAVPDLVLRRKR
ncbi:hypothetical protein Holit_03195 [Hollandina sp. SP2]